jgi:hypothetical protein
MNLLNPAIAVVSAILGTAGAAVAYDAMDVAPIAHPQPAATPERFTVYLPCEAPSVLKKGVCVTTVVKTVVKTPEPRVIVLDAPRPSKKSGGSSGKAASSREHHEDDEGEDEHEDHEHEDDGD